MARTAKTYTLVSLENGVIATYEYTTADALRDALAKYEGEEQPLVFAGEAIPFTVDHSPRVTIGMAPKKERKPRAKKPVEIKPANGAAKKPEVVTAA